MTKYEKNEEITSTDYEEIWWIVKKFIPVVQIMTQYMRITRITKKFVLKLVIILFF